MADPFYDQYTPQHKIKQRIIEAWPTLHNILTHLFFNLWDGLKGMIQDVKRQIGFG